MHWVRRGRWSVVLLCAAVALLSLGCSEFDRLRVRAHLGGADSQLLVGHAYESGVGAQQDLKAAVMWYERAVEQGHPKAFARLGKMYALGAGVRRDMVQANMYFQLGYRRGEKHLADIIAQVERELSGPEIAQSVRLADNWDAQH